MPLNSNAVDSKRAFISHISEEAEVATVLKKALLRDFLGMMELFVSSDTESISAGEQWLSAIEQALSGCSMLLILCSPQSVGRPWINFEAGAAWMRQIPLIPICHSGLVPRDLSMPLSLRQAIRLDDPVGLNRLYARVGEIVGCNQPHVNFEELAVELGKAQQASSDSSETLQDDRALRSRLAEALRHPDVEWRSLKALASEAGISEERAADVLRSDDTVRFSTSEKGRPIVGLKERVGVRRQIRPL
jgi:TIR domain